MPAFHAGGPRRARGIGPGALARPPSTRVRGNRGRGRARRRLGGVPRPDRAQETPPMQAMPVDPMPPSRSPLRAARRAALVLVAALGALAPASAQCESEQVVLFPRV